MYSLRSALFAELIGSFMLVFAATGAVVFDSMSGGAVTPLGGAAVCGLIILSIIHALGEISGAHVNPAVTIAFALAKRFPWARVLPYIFVQMSGALLASALLKWLAPLHPTLGATLPRIGILPSFIIEFILSWWLMVVILNVATGAKEKGIVAGLVIGAVVCLEVAIAGSIAGASMNPARSLAPAIFGGQISSVWIYCVAPITGMASAVYMQRWLEKTPTT